MQVLHFFGKELQVKNAKTVDAASDVQQNLKLYESTKS